MYSNYVNLTHITATNYGPSVTEGRIYLVPSDNNVTITTHNATTSNDNNNNDNNNNNHNNLNITSYAHNSHNVRAQCYHFQCF